MSYEIKCPKCKSVLISNTGSGSCFMSAGSTLGCRNCGHKVILTEDMLNGKPTDKGGRGIRFEI